MKTTFFITARLKSTRLPKKIILPINGRPIISYQIERIKYARTIGEIVVCTSTNPQDDELVDIVSREGVKTFRGSEDDVLLRFLEAAKQNKIDHFANITADCPLIDPSLIDRVVDEYSLHRPDLARYDGDDFRLPFNCYVVSVPALAKICSNKKETDTEMWQRYFHQGEQFKVHKIIAGERYQHETLKTSLDYPEDYEFMKKVFSELYFKDRQFSLLDVIRLTRAKPEILEINSSPDLVKRWRRHQELTTGNKLASPVTGV
jgi:spore coat polysaccharide biosynthesis protein SpsF